MWVKRHWPDFEPWDNNRESTADGKSPHYKIIYFCSRGINSHCNLLDSYKLTNSHQCKLAILLIIIYLRTHKLMIDFKASRQREIIQSYLLITIMGNCHNLNLNQVFRGSLIGLSRLCSATFEQLFAVLATSSKCCLSQQLLSQI